MKLLTGNTYDFKEMIKEKGGKWNFATKTWTIPTDKYNEMQNLINSKVKRNSETIYKISSIPCGKFECFDCGDDVYSGTTCWETGLKHTRD